MGKRIYASLFAMAAILMATPAAHAQSNLTEDEISDGWIELFDGETFFGWNRLGDAEWQIKDEMLTAKKGSGGWIASTSSFQDFELIVKMKVKPSTISSIVFRGSLDGHTSENGSGVFVIDEPKDSDNKTHEIRIVCQGEKTEIWMDGEAAEPTVSPTRSRGVIGINFHGWHFNRGRVRGEVQVEEIKLKPLSMESIFNGKDLSEWNILPNFKAKFAVEDEAIRITADKGQIETKGTYKDFVLQLDIISNGTHLNSGVFFRGPVGVFWKGYESQVRNQWLGDHRDRPTDFGTGGNYGNQATRWVVPSDGEWFKKTIVASDNHAAVWINGYQVSDFTDVRQPVPNNDGKVGYVPGPGTIHLQGHDPTTDLSFKNIKIQEYK